MPWSARCAVVACGHTQALGDKTAEVHDHNPGAADVEASARGGPLDAGGCAQVADADALRARKKRTAAETAIMKSRLVAAPANPSNTGPQSVPAHSHTHTHAFCLRIPPCARAFAASSAKHHANTDCLFVSGLYARHAVNMATHVRKHMCKQYTIDSIHMWAAFGTGCACSQQWRWACGAGPVALGLRGAHRRHCQDQQTRSPQHCLRLHPPPSSSPLPGRRRQEHQRPRSR